MKAVYLICLQASYLWKIFISPLVSLGIVILMCICFWTWFCWYLIWVFLKNYKSRIKIIKLGKLSFLLHFKVIVIISSPLYFLILWNMHICTFKKIFVYLSNVMDKVYLDFSLDCIKPIDEFVVVVGRWVLTIGFFLFSLSNILLLIVRVLNSCY